MGVIRFATDRTVAVLDSSIAGRNVSEWLPGHDIPAVGTLADAMALPEPPDTLLIGIAPTGGKLPPEWRTTILEAIDRGLEVHSGLHTFLGDDPEFSAEAAAKGRPDRRLPASAGAARDRGRAAACARQARDPDGRHGLRDRQDVRRPRAAAGGARVRRQGGRSSRRARRA